MFSYSIQVCTNFVLVNTTITNVYGKGWIQGEYFVDSNDNYLNP